MPGKRKFKDLDPQPAVHESRRTQVYGDRPKPAKKAKQIDFTNRKPTSAVNDLKKHIRDLRRRLERVTDLPADVRAEDERALAAYEQELELAEQKKIRDACIKRWHMVRFFERQKATRHVKRYKKQLLAAETESDVQKYKRKLHIAEVDLNYAQYSPLAEPYISIYPRKKNGEGDVEGDDVEEDEIDGEVSDNTRPPVWIEVEKAMEDGMLNKLRNRAPLLPAKPIKPITRKATAPKPIVKSNATTTKIIPEAEMAGLNRRERRKLLRGEEPATRTRTKIKSMSAGFEKNMAFGAEQAIADKHKAYRKDEEEDESDDGGFFE